MHPLNSYSIDSVLHSAAFQNLHFTFKELVLLSIGLENRPTSMNNGFENLQFILKRFPDLYAFVIPNFNIYVKMIGKLSSQQLLKYELDEKNNSYLLTLSAKGEAEFDYLLMNINHQKPKELIPINT